MTYEGGREGKGRGGGGIPPLFPSRDRPLPLSVSEFLFLSVSRKAVNDVFLSSSDWYVGKDIKGGRFVCVCVRVAGQGFFYFFIFNQCTCTLQVQAHVHVTSNRISISSSTLSFFGGLFEPL